MSDTTAKLPKINLFGERVLFEPVEEELKGSIVLPQKANKQYELGRVLLVGDGKTKDAQGNVKEHKMLVKPGDIVWFQVNPMMAANCVVKFNGKTYMNVLQHDIIARLKTAAVSLENFEILGNWVLLDTFEDRKPGSKIHLPETATSEVRMLRYVVLQKGELVKEVEVGDEVIIEKRAAQLVALNDEPYFYMAGNYIYGLVGHTPEKERALKDKAEVRREQQKNAAKTPKSDSKLITARR